MPLRYVCYDCGSRSSDGSSRCACDEPLWLDTSPNAFDWDNTVDAPGLWRYEPLLPAPLPNPPSLAAAAGGTPLLRDEGLDSFVGASVHLKLEGQQPTGSFKDRGSALALAAMEAGLVGHSSDATAIGTVSHGNMAMSTAAFAAAFDRPCIVLVPDDIPPERLGVIGQFDPTILRVRGDYGRLYERSLELGSEYGIRFVNSDSPLRVEGQKTTALELCEAFGSSMPDAIVLPVSSGGHASGVWKALRELRAAGTIDDLPALYLVQAAACGPIADAFAAGEETVSPVEGGETIAYSIANTDPPSGNRALCAVRETGGAAIAIDDDAIRAAQRELAIEAGVTVETSGAVALAGAKQLVADGALDPTDDVAVVATGTGLTEATTDASAPAVDLGDLGDQLAEFTDR
jgi:threonine synthase